MYFIFINLILMIALLVIRLPIFLKLQKINELFWVASRAEIDNVLGKRELTQPRRLNPCVGINKPGACSLVRVQLTFGSLWEFSSLLAK